jgi:Mn-containing catalase
MFRHTSRLQFESKPDQPDPVYAHKLQELIGGAYGEMTVTMQYLFQGWNCRMPGKYKDLIMDVATEEMGHVEMIATMVARLLEGAPATATTKAALADPVVGAVLGGMDPQQAIVAGGGPLPADSNGYPWNGRYIVASGNLLADFRANVAAEAQGRVQTARLYNMTDDPGVKNIAQVQPGPRHPAPEPVAQGHRGTPGRRPGNHSRPERAVRRGIRRARHLGVAPVRRDRRPGR